MNKIQAVIEITNEKVRLVAGHVIDNEPVIIYSASKEIKGMVSGNIIVNHDALVTAIKQITYIESPELKMKLKINYATIILPPIGFKVFSSRKTTNVVSSTNIVETLDINNAVNLVKKDVQEQTSSIVDIIPASFTLADSSKYTVPPLGLTSKTIEIFASIHTLPKDIVDSYKKVFEDADIRINAMVVSPYAVSEYISHQKDFPKSYLLIDMGHQMTSFSCIGKGQPYGTQIIKSGIDGLINKVVESFGITKEKAYELINVYGIDKRDISFHPPIASSTDEYGRTTNFTQEHLNTILINYLDDYFDKFLVPMEVLLKSIDNDIKKAKILPLVFTGSLIRIPGVQDIIKQKFSTNQSISFARSNTIGASRENYCACIGGLIINNNKNGSLSSVENKVGLVSRN